MAYCNLLQQLQWSPRFGGMAAGNRIGSCVPKSHTLHISSICRQVHGINGTWRVHLYGCHADHTSRNMYTSKDNTRDHVAIFWPLSTGQERPSRYITLATHSTMLRPKLRISHSLKVHVNRGTIVRQPCTYPSGPRAAACYWQPQAAAEGKKIRVISTSDKVASEVTRWVFFLTNLGGTPQEGLNQCNKVRSRLHQSLGQRATRLPQRSRTS